MQELYPSLTAPKDGSVPRAEVTVSTSAALQPWLKSKAWSEPPASGTTGDTSPQPASGTLCKASIQGSAGLWARCRRKQCHV